MGGHRALVLRLVEPGVGRGHRENGLAKRDIEVVRVGDKWEGLGSLCRDFEGWGRGR